MTKDEMAGQIDHLRNALDVLHRAAARDWLEGVKSDSCLDALEYARRTLAATASASAVRNPPAPYTKG